MADQDRPFDPREEELLNSLQRAIDKAVARVCARHVGDEPRDGEEEPALSARIAEAIEAELEHNPMEVDGMRVEVTTRNVRSHGHRSDERRTGVDLLISVVRYDDDQPVSKGLLAQSKLSVALGDDRRRLRNQANRMSTRTNESYVIIIYDDDAVAVPAERARYPKLPSDFERDAMSLGTLIADGLRCVRGDKRIGRDPSVPVRHGLNEVMDRLKAWHAIDFALTND